MLLRFRGGERLQRGRGIGGLLRLAKGLFKPILKSAKAAITSNVAKAIGKAVTNQLVESGANIATDALMGNDVNESIQRGLQNTKQKAVAGVQNLKRQIKQKRKREEQKKKKKAVKNSTLIIFFKIMTVRMTEMRIMNLFKGSCKIQNKMLLLELRI